MFKMTQDGALLLTLVSLACVACGSSSNGGGATGGAAGSAGVGAVDAGSSGGASGGGGTGGGGNAATGGAAGDAGSATGGASGVVSVQALCDAWDQAKCPYPDCLSKFSRTQKSATAFQCASEFDQWLSCATSKPVVCGQYNLAEWDKSCDPAYNALHACVPQCGGGGLIGPGWNTCTVDCNGKNVQFKTKCEGENGSGNFQCSCDTGPKAGKTFSATACASESLAIDECT